MEDLQLCFFLLEKAMPKLTNQRSNGRAVTMNLDGSEMRVEHVDFILKKVGKKL